MDVGDALRDDDDEVVLAGAQSADHLLDDVAVDVEADLIDPAGGAAAGDAGIQRQMARAVAHDLDHRAAVVRLGSVAQAVDGLDCGVERGIETDGIIGAGDVVVDGAGDTDAGDAL